MFLKHTGYPRHFSNKNRYTFHAQTFPTTFITTRVVSPRSGHIFSAELVSSSRQHTKFNQSASRSKAPLLSINFDQGRSEILTSHCTMFQYVPLFFHAFLSFFFFYQTTSQLASRCYIYSINKFVDSELTIGKKKKKRSEKKRIHRMRTQTEVEVLKFQNDVQRLRLLRANVALSQHFICNTFLLFFYAYFMLLCSVEYTF